MSLPRSAPPGVPRGRRGIIARARRWGGGNDLSAAGARPPSARDERLSALWPRLAPVVAFAPLAGFAAAHWGALVVDPPGWRTMAVVVITTAGGAVAGAVRRPAGREWVAVAIRVAVLLATAAAACAAMGLSAGLIWPGGWDELTGGLTRGLTGLRTLAWPYGGPDGWVRLTVLLAIPLVLSAAAALTFWPRLGGGRPPRASGLVLLLTLYGTAVSQHAGAAPHLQGAMLLLLLAAWLFLPRIRRRGAVAAAAMLVAALAASLPLAAGLRADEPVIDYRSWRWLGDPTAYDWNHGYGPIDWPRRGETVLTVESERPHYWKAAALDRFDGLRWVRSETGASAGLDPMLPAAAPERWETEVDVTVGALDSTLIVSPGSARDVEGAGNVTLTRDGAARAEQELEQGTSYSVRAYAPNPSVERMRAAPEPSLLAISSATLIHLPAAGRSNLDVVEEADDADASVPGRPITLPRYSDGLGGTPGAEAYVAKSPYAAVYRLARRLVAGAPTTYDAVRRVEAHLRTEYEYREDPPHRAYPLAAFLFEDTAGYCQHFSGAMALMLRMNGIPARVAAGFSPGERASEGDAFAVRDLDAHSWVEVYFPGLGWVPFDPTPPGSPAASRADVTLASAARGDDGEAGLGLAEALGADTATPPAESGPPAPEEPGGDGGAEAPSRGGSWLLVAALAGVLLAGAGVLVGGRRRARAADAPVREIEQALRRLGHAVAPGTTLMDLERRLGAAGRAAAARYVRRVREHRFAARRRPADAAARRALRSALSDGAGPVGRARGYLVLPPRRR